MKSGILLAVVFAMAAASRHETKAATPTVAAEPAKAAVATNSAQAQAAAPVANHAPSSEDTAKLVDEAVKKAVAEAAAAAIKAAEEKSAKEIAEFKAKQEQAAKDAAAKAVADKEAEKLAKAEAKEAEKVAKEAEKEAKAERKESLKQVDTRIFKLNHASADEVADCFNKMWSGDFGVNWKITKMAVPFPESNSIMVTAPRLILEACEKSIMELDVEAKQVYIEARFVELGNAASHKVGINWEFLDGMTGTATLGGGVQMFKVGEGLQNYTKRSDVSATPKESFTIAGTSTDSSGNTITKNDDASIAYFNGTLDFSQMSMTLQALDKTEDAKTFSNPKIIVSSGKKATVDMTTKYPNVKISTKRTTGTSDSVDIASNMEAIPGEDKFMFAKEAFFSWGISLEVTPRIGTNGLINVSIVPTISSRDSWVETGTTGTDADSGTVSAKYPVIKVQRLITEFNLESGTTAVIGGLSITDEKQVDTGIPVLRSIPWIGPRLFGSMTRVKEQKEIIVFVTVGLVNPRKVEPDAGLPKNAILGRQYVKGQKLEPGDRPAVNMEGYDSLDLRQLEEQAKDPLRQNTEKFSFENYIPFTKEKKESK